MGRGFGAGAFGDCGGLEPDFRTNEVGRLLVGLPLLPTVLAIGLAVVVVGIVAGMAQPGDRQLFAIDLHDSWPPPFFDCGMLGDASRASREDLGRLRAPRLRAFALALGLE